MDSKKFFIETLGCAMNVRDSEHIIAELSSEKNSTNYTQTTNPQEADLIIINTCSVRERPVSKLFSELGKYKKQAKEHTKFGVCGCTASHLGDEIIKRAPYVNFVLGARNVSKIRDVVDQNRIVDVDIRYDDSSYQYEEFRSSKTKAFVNISIGCDKQCTFCIVPHTRGEEISIPQELIVQEAKRAAEQGAKEIFLLGQNVNNYGRRFTQGREKIDFSDLLNLVSEIDAVERIRFTSPHPLHMDDKFLETFASNPKIAKSMHMPLQSGSTRILSDMKRGYSKEWFLERAAKLREMVPQVHIGTDIIVGFPGEREEDFYDTMEVVEGVRFEQMFSFKYSPRPLTKARDFMDQVPDEVASKRLKTLQTRHTEIIDEITDATQGEVMRVYFEELKADGEVAGRSYSNFLVSVKGSEELLGTTRDVLIERPQRTTLYGKII